MGALGGAIPDPTEEEGRKGGREEGREGVRGESGRPPASPSFLPPSPLPPAACPACHAVIDRQLLLPWGDGQHTLPAAPWICATCAALGIIELATGQISIVPEGWWQEVQDRNPVLWQTIARTRARIKGEPHA